MPYRFVRVPGSPDLFRRVEWPVRGAYDSKRGMDQDRDDFLTDLKARCAAEKRLPTEQEWSGFLRRCADRYAAGEADGSLTVDDIPHVLRKLDAKGLIGS